MNNKLEDFIDRLRALPVARQNRIVGLLDAAMAEAEEGGVPPPTGNPPGGPPKPGDPKP